MRKRHKLTKMIQKQYFKRVEQKSKLTQNQLASFFDIVPRSYRDWRRGKFAIPDYTVNLIEKYFHLTFPTSKEVAFTRWRLSKFNASRKGGLTVLRKYGSPGTPEGRSRGGKRGIQILRERGLIPLPKPFFKPLHYSPELAEFVGTLLGDGHIGKEQWSISLNATKDKEYASYLMNISQQLFHMKPSMFVRKNENVIVLLGSGIRSIEYFTNIGLKIGNKVKQQVDVPYWIRNNSTYSMSCLRGLVDTDGGIFYHTYTVNKKQYTYKKLAFVNRSVPLLRFVYRTLQNIGLTPKLIDKVANKRVWLYNQKEVARYLEIIGSHNERLLKFKGGLPER